MRLRPSDLLVLIGLLVATVFGTGCTVFPTGTPGQADEQPGLSSPLAVPKADTSPLGQPPAATGLPPTPKPAGVPTVHIPEQAADVVALARADLAARLGISVDRISVVSVEPVEWNDASLGCPQPGMMYAQVITPGYRVLLEAEGTIYTYHTDQDRAVVLYQGSTGLDLPPPNSADDRTPWQPVDVDPTVAIP